MRRFVVLSVGLLAAALAGGCTTPRIDPGSTPAYSSSERGQMIWRNWNYEGAQAMDDIDSLLLLRPASRMTIWHVR